MRGQWWWIDRWRTSSAFLCMNAEEQGLYRNLLDSVWLMDNHAIPDDERALIVASGNDAAAWARSGQKVLGWMRRTDEGWTNDVALEVIAEAERRAALRAEAGKVGAKARWQTHNKRMRSPMRSQCLLSPSPSLSPKEQHTSASEAPAEPAPSSPPLGPKLRRRDDDAQKVFEAWVSLTGRNPKRTIFSEKRKMRVLHRLREGYTVDDLIDAICGCLASPHHRGENPSGMVFDDLELICRDPQKVDQFLRFRQGGRKDADSEAAARLQTALDRQDAARAPSRDDRGQTNTTGQVGSRSLNHGAPIESGEEEDGNQEDDDGA